MARFSKKYEEVREALESMGWREIELTTEEEGDFMHKCFDGKEVYVEPYEFHNSTWCKGDQEIYIAHNPDGIASACIDDFGGTDIPTQRDRNRSPLAGEIITYARTKS